MQRLIKIYVRILLFSLKLLDLPLQGLSTLGSEE